METDSLSSIVIEQSWHYNKVDELVLERWMREIQQLEKKRLKKQRHSIGKENENGLWKIIKFKRNLISEVGHEIIPVVKEDISCSSEPSRPLKLAESLLTSDCWSQIFLYVELKDLPQCATVCTLFNHLIREKNMWAKVFADTWRLSSVVGFPTTAAFRKPTIAQFALCHELTHSDTILSLALQYNSTMGDIRRQNMLMSDHGIHLRERIFVPIKAEEFLVGKDCFIEKDPYSRREVAVIYPTGRGGEPSERSRALARARAARTKQKVTKSFQASLGVDESTASYYLDLSNGDLRKAYAEYLEDMKWEKRQGFGEEGS